MMKSKLITQLSDEQLKKVVGGVGIGATPGTSAGFNGWGAGGSPSAGHGLFSAGFMPDDFVAGRSGNKIIVPGRPD